MKIKKIIDEIIKAEERRLIALYNTTNHSFGYNLTEGGDGIVGYKFSNAAIEKMRIKTSGKNHWNYGKKNSAGKKVKQFSLFGEFVAEFPSIKEAERQTTIKACNISQCCNNKADSAGGFIWIWSDKYFDGYIEKYKSRASCKSNDKAVLQYDFNGNFIKKYCSAAEAGREINGKDCGAVAKAASGGSKSAYNYIYIYECNFAEDLLKEKVTAIKKIKKTDNE